jgi:uncharacterized protein (TIGR02246 family)
MAALMANQASLKEIAKLEEEGWRGLASDRAAAFYGRIMTDDAVMVVPGAVMSHDAVLSAWDGVAPWATYQLDEHRVRALGENAALITYRGTARRAGDANPYVAQFTSIYEQCNGEWRLVFHQQTPQP